MFSFSFALLGPTTRKCTKPGNCNIKYNCLSIQSIQCVFWTEPISNSKPRLRYLYINTESEGNGTRFYNGISLFLFDKTSSDFNHICAGLGGQKSLLRAKEAERIDSCAILEPIGYCLMKISLLSKRINSYLTVNCLCVEKHFVDNSNFILVS